MRKDNPDSNKPSLLRRVVALVALGMAIALAVVQVTNMLRHDVLIRLLLSDEILHDIRKIEMVAWMAGQSNPSYKVEVNFDQNHPAKLPIEHKFELTNGKYEMQFRVFGFDKFTYVRTSRRLEVSGPVSVSYQLP